MTDLDDPTEENTSTPPAVHGALIVVGLIFGINHVWAKVVLDHIPPFTVAAMRAGTAAVVLSTVHVITVRERVENWKDLGELALYALFGVVINQLFYLKGLSLTTSVNTSVLIITIPVFTTCISVYAGFEKGTLPKWIGLCLAGGGALILSGVEAVAFDMRYAAGNLLITLNSISYALYLVISKRLLRKYHPVTVVKWIYLFGSLVVVPVGMPGALEHSWGAVPVSAWLAVVYVILFSTIVVYFINLWALKRTTSSVVAVYIYLQPLIAGFLAVGLGREEITFPRVVSALLIFAGVYLTSVRGRDEQLGSE